MPLFSWKKSGDLVGTRKPNSVPSSPAKTNRDPKCASNGDLSSLASESGPSPSPSHSPAPTLTRTQPNPDDLIVSLAEIGRDSFLFVTPLKTKSRLSPVLMDILRDHSALMFFIQFMESRDATSLIRFWLDADSFHACTYHYEGAMTRAGCDRDVEVSKLNGALELDSKTPEARSLVRSAAVSGSAGDHPMVGGDPQSTKCTNLTKDLSDKGLVARTVSDTAALQGRCKKSLETDASAGVSSDGTKHAGMTTSQVHTFPSDRNNFVGLSMHIIHPQPNELLAGMRHNCFDSVPVPNSDITTRGCNDNRRITEDAVKLYTKYIAKAATHPIHITDEMRNNITAKICPEDGLVSSTCFIPAQEFVEDVMEKEYFSDYIQSDYHCKYQIDVLTSGKVHMEDILYNETALSFFMEFVEQEGQRSLLDLWLMADNFRKHLLARGGNYDPNEVQDDAMVLYDKYFSLQATCQLGFSDEIRFEVEHNICREDGPLPDCFEKPVKMVLRFLNKNCWRPFLSSQLYFTYLSELLNSARGSQTTLSQKKRSGSDSSSEHSLTVLNTLLAMDGTQPGVQARKILRNVGGQDMRIDTGTFNPDALWKRSSMGKLSMGRVNRLGQFITEFEPEPDKRRMGESMITKAVKKLVNKDADKAKEEMAWQVADMIVKEVTNVTCQHFAEKPS